MRCVTAEVLQAKWKEWMTEALGELGAVPAGNAPGNREWLTRKRKTPAGWDKPELVVGGDGGGSLEERLAALLATHDVVAFIKGTRKSPECTFSQSMVTMLHVRWGLEWLSDSPLFAHLSACHAPSTTRRLQVVCSPHCPKPPPTVRQGSLRMPEWVLSLWLMSRTPTNRSESWPRDACPGCKCDVQRHDRW